MGINKILPFTILFAVITVSISQPLFAQKCIVKTAKGPQSMSFDQFYMEQFSHFESFNDSKTKKEQGAYAQYAKAMAMNCPVYHSQILKGNMPYQPEKEAKNKRSGMEQMMNKSARMVINYKKIQAMHPQFSKWLQSVTYTPGKKK